jgi:hypothetical protein
MAATKKDAATKKVEPKTELAPDTQILSKVWARLTGPSRLYIVEHFMLLIALVLVIISGAGLFNQVIDYYFENTETVAYSSYGVSAAAESIILYLSLGVVALPLGVLLFQRTRRAERLYPRLRDSRPRRRLSYAFLMVAALFILGLSVVLVYNTIMTIAGVESYSATEPWLKVSVKLAFDIALIGIVAILVSRLGAAIEMKGAKNANK